MKRLFPRAVPEALLGLLAIAGSCAPSDNVPPGAPVLTSLTIVDPSGSKVSVTSDTPACASGAAEGTDCDPGTSVCELGNVICNCVAKGMCDPTIKAGDAMTGGTLNCTFASMSTVVATFDRLLYTVPFVANTPVAALTATPTTTATAATAYTSSGATVGLFFPDFFGIPNGPSIAVTGNPALPAGSTVTLALDKANVLAKDGKTPFTGIKGPIIDGTISFKTAAFSAGITVPSAPPPMAMAPAMMGCPDSGMAAAGADAAADANAEAGTEAGSDASTDGGAEVGVEAGAEAGGATDAGSATSDAGGTTDAAADAVSTAAPISMNMASITINFTNPVGMDVLSHVTMTEDGADFTAFAVPMSQTFPNAVVTLNPTTAWAAGKTYSITVDKSAADVLKETLGTAVSSMFTMSSN
jgi:hypothetical protein